MLLCVFLLINDFVYNSWGGGWGGTAVRCPPFLKLIVVYSYCFFYFISFCSRVFDEHLPYKSLFNEHWFKFTNVHGESFYFNDCISKHVNRFYGIVSVVKGSLVPF